jgi:hypothetical protein
MDVSSREKEESLVANMRVLRQLSELRLFSSTRSLSCDGISLQLATALFDVCPSIKSIDGQTVAGKIWQEDDGEVEKENDVESSTIPDYCSSDSDDQSEYDRGTETQSSERRKSNRPGSAAAIKEILQIDDVPLMEGHFKDLLSNCKDTLTVMLKLADSGEIAVEALEAEDSSGIADVSINAGTDSVVEKKESSAIDSTSREMKVNSIANFMPATVFTLANLKAVNTRNDSDNQEVNRKTFTFLSEEIFDEPKKALKTRVPMLRDNSLSKDHASLPFPPTKEKESIKLRYIV